MAAPGPGPPTASAAADKEPFDGSRSRKYAAEHVEFARIRGVIRLRPVKPNEVRYIDLEERAGTTLQVANLDYTDTFTSVLGPESTQSDVFRHVGLPLVETALRGLRTCLFAYGQTGSGKTFSMYGAEGGKNPSKLDGIVPSICAEIFRRKQELEKRKEMVMALTASLTEVQGSTVLDLLAEATSDGTQPLLKLRGSEVMGATHLAVHSSRGLTQLIEFGMSRRQTGQNVTHAHSSRSHAFLTIFIEKRIMAGTKVTPPPPHLTTRTPKTKLLATAAEAELIPLYGRWCPPRR